MIRLVKSPLCRVLSAGGLDTWLGRVTGSLHRPWIVNYHTVVADAREVAVLMPGLAVTTTTFERHLEWIGKHFEVAPLDEVWTLQSRRAPGRKPPAAITFDDGYRSVFELAWPILRGKGMPAAMFVVTDRIGTDEPSAHDRLYRALRRRLGPADAYRQTRALLRDPGPGGLESLFRRLGDEGHAAPSERPATWPMLSELRAAGWTIGSHTRSHPLLTRIAAADMAEELRGSREILERRLGGPVLHFAYPDGAYDRVAVDAVAAAGYRFAYTICAHSDPDRAKLTVPRTGLWERSSIDRRGQVVPAILSCQSSGLLDLLGPCRADHSRAHPSPGPEAEPATGVTPGRRAGSLDA